MGVGVKRAAGSCYELGSSSPSSLLFTSPPAFDTPLVQIPLNANTHTFHPVLIFPFVRHPHPNLICCLKLALSPCLFISLEQLRTSSLPLFVFVSPSRPPFLSALHRFSRLTSLLILRSLSELLHAQSVRPAVSSVLQNDFEPNSCPCGHLFKETLVFLSPWLRCSMATSHW